MNVTLGLTYHQLCYSVGGCSPYEKNFPLKRHQSLCREAFRPVRMSGMNEQIKVQGTREVRRDAIQH